MANQRTVNGPATDIHHIIQAYCDEKDKNITKSRTRESYNKKALEKLDQAISEQEASGQSFTVSFLQTKDGADVLEDAIGDLIDSWPSRSKNKAAITLMEFLKHLKDKFDIELDKNDLPRDIPDITERRLDMLKYLHKPHTMKELEKQYLSSDRTLRGDLGQLENGWELLGTRMQIQKEVSGKQISYNSTIHPVLLPLNLTEIYHLVLSFPKLAQGTVCEDFARYFSDMVCEQLSDYAIGILRQTDLAMKERTALWNRDGKRNKNVWKYRQEESMLQKNRNDMITYTAKQSQRCRIWYVDDEGQERKVEGVPSLRHGDLRFIGLVGMQELIPLDKILLFENLEKYK